MNMKTAKTPAEIKLAGVTIEFERADSQLRAVIIRDTAGGMLRIAKSGSYDMEALIPAPPRLVARYRVRGEVAGVPIDETFAHDYQATARIIELGLAKTEPEKLLVEE